MRPLLQQPANVSALRLAVLEVGGELQPSIRQAQKEQAAMTLIITAPKAEQGRFAALYRLRGYKLTATKKIRNGFWRIVAWR